MNDIPHIIEAALLLLIAFLLGCIIGWFLRAKIFKKRQKTAPSKAVEPVAKSKTQILEKGSDTGAKAIKIAPKAVPDEKATPKPTGTSPKLNVVASKPRKAAIAEIQKPNPASDTHERASTGGEVDADKSELGRPKAGQADAGKSDSGKPEALSAPRSGGKDDLKKIKGVGPKLENTLNGLGIFHFDQIAKWKRVEIDWVDNYLSFKGRIDRDDWISQAKKFSA